MRSGIEEKFVPKIALITTIDDPPIESIFSKAEIILGRDSTCDFPIDDDRVSMHHCKITHKQNQWWVEDLNSTNGTFLNESFVNTKIILINGDILRLGHVEIIIKI
jgi:pSer/pThr/pTyr-binding forkhead associated (FHA) protein